MHYVYILQSEVDSRRYYTGFTYDVVRRLREHNRGKNLSTKAYRPWKVKSYIAFMDKDRAHAFERYLKTGSGRQGGQWLENTFEHYLKSHSGRAFAKKRL